MGAALSHPLNVTSNIACALIQAGYDLRSGQLQIPNETLVQGAYLRGKRNSIYVLSEVLISISEHGAETHFIISVLVFQSSR